MTDPKDTWNPEDGPPPTAEEISEARALADALDPGARRRPADPALAEAMDVALRLRATAHPDAQAARTVAARAVTDALAQARSPWSARRFRWGLVAACAVLVAGVGGVQLARPRTPTPRATISRPATDVFTAPVEPGAASVPADRIYDSRLRSYRAVLLRGGAR